MASSASYCACESFVLLCVPAVCLGSLLYTIPLCEYTSFNPSLVLLRAIWVVSGLALLCVVLL